jgi:L-amino acid N-acyltransferase YncA
MPNTRAAAISSHFPWTTSVAGTQISFRLMVPEDRDEVLRFVNSLPETDLFYLMNDVRDPAAMNRWTQGLRDHLAYTVLAESGGQLLGYGSLFLGRMRWTRHLGEIRIMVGSSQRSRGLGKMLAHEIFAVAHDLGLRRIIARLTAAQVPARHMFQRLGFHIEALLADCVIDEDGRTDDLVIMSYDVSGFHE